jgi:hypothetical protein
VVDVVLTDGGTIVPADEPIPALLPRDWPAQLLELCDNLEASPAARQAAFAFVDGWVLAAVDATTEEDR